MRIPLFPWGRGRWTVNRSSRDECAAKGETLANICDVEGNRLYLLLRLRAIQGFHFLVGGLNRFRCGSIRNGQLPKRFQFPHRIEPVLVQNLRISGHDLGRGMPQHLRDRDWRNAQGAVLFDFWWSRDDAGDFTLGTLSTFPKTVHNLPRNALAARPGFGGGVE